jgi:hypothetical protein
MSTEEVSLHQHQNSLEDENDKPCGDGTIGNENVTMRRTITIDCSVEGSQLL